MNIKIFLIFISAFLLGCNRESSTVTPSQDSSHFEFILYDGLSDTIIPPIKEKLEGNYSRILNDLQVNSLPVVKVKIWNNESRYLSEYSRLISMD